MLIIAAALAIVVQDHTSLRVAPRSDGTELTALWQGDILEVRDERADYLKVYDYRHERAGYVRSERARPIGATESDAASLLAVLRFLRNTRGSEALGISYGAAYIKAAPPKMLTAEAFAAIGSMAERLADQASGTSTQSPELAAHLEVVEQLGIHMHSFERLGRMQVCYDGELFRRVLASTSATSEERAQAALALTRPECTDPALGVSLRQNVAMQRCALLDGLSERGLTALTLARVRARRAVSWASMAYERARHNEPGAEAAQRALSELLSLRADDLGADRQAEYVDAVIRVGTIRWAAQSTPPQEGRFVLASSSSVPGQTCVVLQDRQGPNPGARIQRCTWGIVWMSSVQAIGGGRILVLAVQPLESWRELWVFHEQGEAWRVDVVTPGADEPEEGYVEFAGYAPRTQRMLIAREVKAAGHFRRRFEELRIDDLALVKGAGNPDLLVDFGHWQDLAWRRDTLSLH